MVKRQVEANATDLRPRSSRNCTAAERSESQLCESVNLNSFGNSEVCKRAKSLMEVGKKRCRKRRACVGSKQHPRQGLPFKGRAAFQSAGSTQHRLAYCDLQSLLSTGRLCGNSELQPCRASRWALCVELFQFRPKSKSRLNHFRRRKRRGESGLVEFALQ